MVWGWKLTHTQFRAGHAFQTGLGLAGQAGENEGDVETGVFVALAGNDDAGAIEFAAIARRLEGNGHFRPGMEGRGAAKFDPAFVDDHLVGGKFQPGLAGFHGYGLLKTADSIKFSCTHSVALA